MKKGICYIVAAGEKSKLDFVPTADDLVIAADGGYDYLLDSSLRTDLIVGDMDSVCAKTHKDINIVKLPCEKGDTDTLAAVRIGLERGYKTFKIYCAMGGRFSHTFANVQTLEFLAKRNARGYIIADNGTTTVIHNDELRLEGCKGYVSVFSLSPETITTIKGLKYEIENTKLVSTFPVGTSNEFTNKAAIITAKNGSLLIVYNE
jgi:thiamine pyrophosphokinase